MKITSSNLMRLAGSCAVPAGIIFAAIQPIHPPDVVESVTTTAWAIITPVKTAMCFLFLIGITGLYARQVDRAGWLGLAGFLMLIVSWTLQTAFVFAEAFILPLLAVSVPAFVDGSLGISYGHTGGVDLGALPTLYSVGVGIDYMLGGLLFGVATFRAGVLPRLPAALLAVAATLTPLAALLPHAQQRFAAVPVALALAWLGYALWSERRVTASQAAPATAGAHLRPAAAR
ncbi:MAG TPA: hypothetical protein VKV73_02860 [Chloroflexota bacterium]|nr:hypothetical protein [Chloroflexota bacterium]